MKRLLRKLLVIVVLFAPLLVNTDCKKQKKCGCRGDILNDYDRESHVFFDNETNVIYMQQVGYVGYYFDSYTFCNPGEWKTELEEKYKTGDVLVVKGHYYWDCNFVMQQSGSYGYGYSGRSYNIYVTEMYMEMYGKDNPDETLKRAQ